MKTVFLIISIICCLTGCTSSNDTKLQLVDKIKKECKGKVSMSLSVNPYFDTITFACDDMVLTK